MELKYLKFMSKSDLQDYALTDSNANIQRMADKSILTEDFPVIISFSKHPSYIRCSTSSIYYPHWFKNAVVYKPKPKLNLYL